VTRFEDTLRGRVDATYIPFQAKFSAKGSVLVSSAERDAIVDALAALRRIADENDALLGIGSEMEFAQEVFARLDAGVSE
jgi:hypothetical protein